MLNNLGLLTDIYQFEQMKKAKTKKPAAKKEEKIELAAEATKVDDKEEAEAAPEPAAEDTNGEPSKGEGNDTTKDTETVPELNKASSHHRAPSVSQQSKMRSSSFRQSGGLTSPGYFPAEGDTAPDIHRKQAMKIEELEKENKRLSKEASDGEKRWKKAEEELEDLREAEGDSPSKLTAGGSSGEVEKLVSYISVHDFVSSLSQSYRKQKLLLFNVKIPNYKHSLDDGMAHLHLWQQHHLRIWKPSYFLKTLLLNPWRLKYRLCGLSWTELLLVHPLRRNK